MALLRGENYLPSNRSYLVFEKIENFMLISKMQTYLCDKMPPKKLKLKNEKNGTKQN
jgi:hypothetical protein